MNTVVTVQTDGIDVFVIIVIPVGGIIFIPVRTDLLTGTVVGVHKECIVNQPGNDLIILGTVAAPVVLVRITQLTGMVIGIGIGIIPCRMRR